MTGTEIKLRYTAKVLGDAFRVSEDGVKQDVQRIFPNADEETVTVLLHYRLFNAVHTGGFQNQVRIAFRQDLEASLHNSDHFAIQAAADRIVAKVIWHSRTREGKTGGDLALKLLSPVIPTHFSLGQRLPLRYRAMLVQAKRNRGKVWRGFTKPQKAKLEEIRGFLAILLYRFQGDGLSEMAWCPCKDHTNDTVLGWFPAGGFPKLCSSSDIIQQMANGLMGTADSALIEKYIEANNGQSVEVLVHWPDDDPAALQAFAHLVQPKHQLVQIRQRVQRSV